MFRERMDSTCFKITHSHVQGATWKAALGSFDALVVTMAPRKYS
jgi:hypothetical protein